MYDDEDNDGKFPDEILVEVRYPRSKQEEKGDRERWPWLPGTIVEQCGPEEWYVCVEVRELAVLRDGRRAPRGTASRNLCYPCCFRDGSKIRPRTTPGSAASGARRGRPADRGPGDPLHDGGRGLRRGRLRGGGQILPHLPQSRLARHRGVPGAACSADTGLVLEPLGTGSPPILGTCTADSFTLVVVHRPSSSRAASSPRIIPRTSTAASVTRIHLSSLRHVRRLNDGDPGAEYLSQGAVGGPRAVLAGQEIMHGRVAEQPHAGRHFQRRGVLGAHVSAQRHESPKVCFLLCQSLAARSGGCVVRGMGAR